MEVILDVEKNKSDKRAKGVILSDDLDIIRNHFSVENKGANFGRYRKYGRKANSVNIRKYAITGTGKFHIGLYAALVQYFKSNQIKYKMSDAFKRACKCPYKDTIHELNLEPYEHQTEALIRGLKHGCGVFEIGTGGGKTLTMATLINSIMVNTGDTNHKTAVIVPSIQLVEQTYKDFISYGINEKTICKYSGNNKLDPTANIIIVGKSILDSKKRDNSWIYNVDLLLVDECHSVKRGNQISKVVEEIKTPHRFGFTGTLPEDSIDVWNVFGVIGPLLYVIKSKELRDKNVLSDALVCTLILKHLKAPSYERVHELKRQKKPIPPQLKWEIENEFLYENKWRNGVLSSLCKNIKGNILIMVDRIIYGELLEKILKEDLKDKEVFFIQGDVKVDIRENIKSMMETKDNIICIAISKLFSTGINIKNLPYIIFTIAGVAKVKLIQSIGRGLRLHDNKDKLTIFDISDNFEYSMRQLKERLKLYSKEQLEVTKKEIYEK